MRTGLESASHSRILAFSLAMLDDAMVLDTIVVLPMPTLRSNPLSFLSNDNRGVLIVSGFDFDLYHLLN
jgi:hypothetical protein